MGWNERSDPDMRTANFCDVYREGVYSGTKLRWKCNRPELSRTVPYRAVPNRTVPYHAVEKRQMFLI